MSSSINRIHLSVKTTAPTTHPVKSTHCSSPLINRAHQLRSIKLMYQLNSPISSAIPPVKPADFKPSHQSSIATHHHTSAWLHVSVKSTHRSSPPIGQVHPPEKPTQSTTNQTYLSIKPIHQSNPLINLAHPLVQPPTTHHSPATLDGLYCLRSC